ncbi:expressed unknown protein [Seminavis robusta]|uniref:Uncharacterized protein n=1 Tax=Seminavis robusta TaxID=568900 RepID=A0A9N8F031_9STRA|nr:expressed unknown protein [Seminavis robusta]|eukprot:Sro3344_g347020.1 n/a (454) ;mRNA; f:3832-5279
MASVPAIVKQEIINVIAIHGRETVYQSRSEGATKEQQYAMLNNSYHGAENHMPLLETFLYGRPPYNVAFTSHDIQNNREGNDIRKNLRQEFMLELKDVLHCQTGQSYMVHERGFTKEALMYSTGTRLIDGRNLTDRAGKVQANYKHAHRFFLQYNDNNKEQDNPSGKKIEDMLLYVRKKMFAFLKGCRDTSGLKNKKDQGKLSLSALNPDNEGIEKKGRKTARKEEAEEKKAQREAGIGGYIPPEYVRGVPLQAKANAALMEQRQWQEERTHARDSWFIASTEYSQLRKELQDVKKEIADCDSGDDEELASLKQWKSDVLEQMATLRQHKKVLQKRNSEFLLDDKRPKKNAVTAFMQQVGTFNGQTVASAAKVPQTVEERTNKDDASSLGQNSAPRKEVANARDNGKLPEPERLSYNETPTSQQAKGDVINLEDSQSQNEGLSNSTRRLLNSW